MRKECEQQCTKTCLYGLESIINTLGRKWTLLIINTIGNHQRIRYKDIMNELQNITPKTLSDSLKRLEKGSIIKRECFNEIPPRVEYSLTQDGEELRKAIIPILEWVSKKYSQSNAKCEELNKWNEITN